MQKVVSLFLDTEGAKHGDVEEHLGEYLMDGWRVASVTAAGGHSAAKGVARVVVLAVLERSSRDRAD